MPEDRLVSYQFSDEGNGPSPTEASAISVVASAYGEGQQVDFGLFVMVQGAQEKAAEAAELGSRTVTSEMMQKFYYMTLLDDSPPPITETLEAAFKEADAVIRAETHPGAVAVTVAVVVANQLYLAHVGNSRAYLIANDELYQLTTDYALPGTKGAADAIRALGHSDQMPEIEFMSRQLPANARVLLCNKAVWDEGEIHETMQRYANPESACGALVESAKEREIGNIAAILMQTPGG